MRRLYSRLALVMGPVQEVSDPEARVTVDDAVRDRFGVPVAATSVTDEFGRVWGHDNLYGVDGSLHVTTAAFTPSSRSWRWPTASAAA